MYHRSVRYFPPLDLVLLDRGVDFGSDSGADFGFGPLARRLRSACGGRGSGIWILVCLVGAFLSYSGNIQILNRVTWMDRVGFYFSRCFRFARYSRTSRDNCIITS